jgi:hypothetical protein
VLGETPGLGEPLEPVEPGEGLGLDLGLVYK